MSFLIFPAFRLPALQIPATLMLMLWAGAWALLWPGAGHAQGLSCNRVSIIVPAAVGSGSDLVARAIAEAANAAGNTAYRVQNRPRDIAREMIGEAAPDGCTLLLDSRIRVALEVMRGDRGAWRDLTPVALLTHTPVALALSRKAPGGAPGGTPGDGQGAGENEGETGADALQRIVAALRVKPESVTFALLDDPLEQLQFLHLEESLGIRFRIRSFASGAARFRAMLDGPPGLVSFVSIEAARARGGALRILQAPVRAGRNAALTPGSDHGLYGPAGLPAAATSAHAKILSRIMKMPGTLAELHAAHGTETRLLTGDEFTRYLENLAADWKDMLGRQNNRGRLGRKS